MISFYVWLLVLVRSIRHRSCMRRIEVLERELFPKLFSSVPATFTLPYDFGSNWVTTSPHIRIDPYSGTVTSRSRAERVPHFYTINDAPVAGFIDEDAPPTVLESKVVDKQSYESYMRATANTRKDIDDLESITRQLNAFIASVDLQDIHDFRTAVAQVGKPYGWWDKPIVA